MGIYSRLYTYRETPSLSPVENFLTEALAEHLQSIAKAAPN